jgi:hypothetical protein
MCSKEDMDEIIDNASTIGSLLDAQNITAKATGNEKKKFSMINFHQIIIKNYFQYKNIKRYFYAYNKIS